MIRGFIGVVEMIVGKREVIRGSEDRASLFI